VGRDGIDVAWRANALLQSFQQCILPREGDNFDPQIRAYDSFGRHSGSERGSISDEPNDFGLVQ
jgi:hypothetical protein